VGGQRAGGARGAAGCSATSGCRAWTSSLMPSDWWSPACCLGLGYRWLLLQREDKTGCFYCMFPFLGVYLLTRICFHCFDAVFGGVDASSLRQPCLSLVVGAVPCAATRARLCLPPVRGAQFYTCGFISAMLCSILTRRSHRTTSVSRNQHDLAFQMGLQGSCSCLGHLLPVTCPPSPLRRG